MTAFWIAAGLLVAGALLFVLPPLLGMERVKRLGLSRDEANLSVLRDQLGELESDLARGSIDRSQYERARRELEERVLEDVGAAQAQTAAASPSSRRAAIAVGLAVPLLAIPLYLVVGNPKALDPQQVPSAESRSHAITPQQIEAMTERLAQRLKENPDDVQGWIMLARSYSAMGRFAEAGAAYARATALLPNDAQLLADRADTVAMVQGRRLQGEPEQLIARALQLDPDNVKALALAGTAAFERKDYAGAVARWQRIVSLVPPDSDIARSIASSIDEAKALAGMPAGTPPPVAAAEVVPGLIQGVVDLDPALRSAVSDSDTVFIFARPAEGSRMPLAVVRKQVKDLPAAFSLDDSMSMSPSARLSAYPRVIVGARISKSGNASPGPGDLQGLSAPVNLGANKVKILIDSRQEKADSGRPG